MKKYNTPIISTIDVVFENSITASSQVHFCDESCKHWHFCRDRHYLNHCVDKKS